MRFIDFNSADETNTLFINETSVPELETGQVLVKVAAFGINRADILQKKGQYPPPVGESPILGLEMAGEIVEMPAELMTSSSFKIGDRVYGLVAGGAYAEYVAVDVQHLLATPSSLTDDEAAGVAECFLTAYQSMFVEYNLAKKSRVLIHAGASGVGLAATQLAKQWDCHIAVTASSSEKLHVCQSNGAALLINYKQQDFVEALKAHDKRDLIIDFIGADYVNRNLSVANQDACIIQLAMLGGRYAEKIDMAQLLGKRVTLKGSTLRSRTGDYKAHLVAEFAKQFGDTLSKQLIKPNIEFCYSVDEINTAHARMENNLNTGKLVVHW
ncbi:MAG: NAD(P)H-quinone oxidoreductase [Paraglaciecola sp.]|uniref:NAD(P)H-quinone oxidoreductase n=1 Tax=Paraglaciecola sp. TaxID=1920173 RepID=UPI00273E0604|nr:NAD(P)H-quinone oxidoreductase [Paraglaciecola sp.]MDP5029423.1 NAD(P)H-quinone oxidoreductase [Paraglaciecola sp.]MDP5133010.1 NAD(P)H-quinone oxidoreductase [Paraglaciecola sp.]